MSRVAVVTGARKGLGKGLAERLLSAGYAVVGCGRGECSWEHNHFRYLRLDVSQEQDVKTLIREAVEVGPPYAVINNAATASMNHTLLTPATSLDDMLASNVRSTFLVSREAAKVMRKTGVGRIVNISSVAVPLRLAGQAAYVAAKAAVERLTQVMARDLGDLGITVNVVGPAPTATDMIRGVPPDKIERLIQSFPIKRLGTIDDVWNAVEFFLRPESEAVTGQILYLGGTPNG